MYFIHLFAFTATRNLSSKQWLLLQLQRVIKWNITGSLVILFYSISYLGQIRWFFSVILLPEDLQFERTTYRI